MAREMPAPAVRQAGAAAVWIPDSPSAARLSRSTSSAFFGDAHQTDEASVFTVRRILERLMQAAIATHHQYAGLGTRREMV
jgi:hypothetical protein